METVREREGSPPAPDLRVVDHPSFEHSRRAQGFRALAVEVRGGEFDSPLGLLEEGPDLGLPSGSAVLRGNITSLLRKAFVSERSVWAMQTGWDRLRGGPRG